MKEGATGNVGPETANEPVPKTRGMVMNWQAPFYDWGCRAIGLGRKFRDETLRHAALKSGERVLDVGCGTGVLTRLAAAENSQMMLCGNPDMVRDTTEILLVLGMKKSRRRDPEQISVERCW